MNFKFLKIFRLEQWWIHILPPIFLFYFAGTIQLAVYDKKHALYHCLMIAGLSIITGFWGYFINDFFDINEDKKANKKNHIADFPKWQKIITIPVLTVLIYIIYYLLSSEISNQEALLYLCTFLLNVLFFILYSIPPIRLKQSIFLAPVADALYSGTFFYILAYAIGSSVKLISINSLLLSFIILFAYGFSKGLRNYLLHLTDDFQYDIISGLNTLSTRYGIKKINNIANTIFPIEVTLLLFFILMQKNISYVAICICVIFIIIWFIFVQNDLSKKYVILNDLHEVWLPLCFLVQLIIKYPSLYFFGIIYVILFPYHLYKIYCLIDFIYYKTIFKLVGPIRNNRNNS